GGPPTRYGKRSRPSPPPGQARQQQKGQVTEAGHQRGDRPAVAITTLTRELLCMIHTTGGEFPKPAGGLQSPKSQTNPTLRLTPGHVQHRQWITKAGDGQGSRDLDAERPIPRSSHGTNAQRPTRST